MKTKIFLLLLAGLFIFNSCMIGRMIQGDGETITINSAPSGAMVYIVSGKEGLIHTAKTPFKPELKHDDTDYYLTFVKKGYKPRYIKLENTGSGWLVADLIVLSYTFFSALFALKSGKFTHIYTLDKDHIEVKLIPLG